MGKGQIVNGTEELRKLIIDNPKLPLVVVIGSGSGDEDYDMFCPYVYAEIGEFLDCEQMFTERRCFCNRDDFVDAVRNFYEDKYDYFEGSRQDFEIYVDNKIDEYEPYWVKCILLYVYSQ